MNDKNPTQAQDPTTPQPVSENSVTTGEISQSTNEELPPDEHVPERKIDLNELFPDVEKNLNDLFPELEVKHLLKNITKNKIFTSFIQVNNSI